MCINVQCNLKNLQLEVVFQAVQSKYLKWYSIAFSHISPSQWCLDSETAARNPGCCNLEEPQRCFFVPQKGSHLGDEDVSAVYAMQPICLQYLQCLHLFILFQGNLSKREAAWKSFIQRTRDGHAVSMNSLPLGFPGSCSCSDGWRRHLSGGILKFSLWRVTAKLSRHWKYRS